MQSSSVWTRKPLSAALMAAGLGFAYGPVRAATITVTTSGDAGTGATCTLRQAIVAVNTASLATTACVNSGAAFGTGDTVNFQAGLASPITLASQISATASVQINGPGAGALTLSGGGTTRMLFLQPAASGETFGISALTFANGSGASGGGAIRFYANGTTNITIANSTFTGNHAAGGGGALYIQSLGAGGTLLIQSSTFSGNVATSDGGAMYLESSQAGTITVQDSTLSGNTCGDDGGAIYQGTGTLVVQRTTISGNSCPHNGGGISRNSTGGVTTIQNSTITGNTVTLTAAAFGGGGIRLNGNTSTIDNSTIAGNSTPGGVGGNIEMQGAGTLTLRSTIVSGGTDSSGARDIFVQSGATTFTVSNSLVQNVGNSGITATGGNLIAVNPLLGPLANNGGPTQTMALLAGSPAIDTGSNPDGLATDQRGPGFLRVAGAAADIGGFEVQAALGSTGIPALDDRALLALIALAGLGGALALRRKRAH